MFACIARSVLLFGHANVSDLNYLSRNACLLLATTRILSWVLIKDKYLQLSYQKPRPLAVFLYSALCVFVISTMGF